MKKVLFFLAIIVVITLHAEVRIFKGWSESYSDCKATYKNGRIYKGWSESYSDCIATIKDGRIYKGWSESYSDCIFSFSEAPPSALVVWLMYYYYRGEF